MKLKVCGMKYDDNIQAISELQPEYMGFIFYEKSPRNYIGKPPKLKSTIKTVGVFVDEGLEEILRKLKKFKFEAIQLHGSESPDYCIALKKKLTSLGHNVKIIKVFSIKNEFNFDVLKSYEDCCDYFLFDTKGKLPGGNGYTFDWKILEHYPSNKPYFLSGGIGLETIEELIEFFKTDASKFCEVVDVNSRFEVEPGLKNAELVKLFTDLVKKSELSDG